MAYAKTIEFEGPVFKEEIRLIIWDLDETFWKGTLTEGGATIDPALVDLVRTLSSRGIMSSICSKNDHKSVQDLLTQHDIWDNFIFPSISWESKGSRIRKIIEQVQLRPETVLFIDDNPTNLAEAKSVLSGLNVASDSFISSIVGHLSFMGKDDPGFSRLKQYKQMESRQAAASETEGDPRAFLRESNISVTFNYDISSRLDRVIELINRTNQLNFTKLRVSEDPELAKSQLYEYINRYNLQCALISVKDAFGDHGECGLYVYQTELRQLIQFCFSCRILGLGVEQWVYNKLGRPSITVVGEVISDLNDPFEVDWINSGGTQAGHLPALAQAVTARGGCELAAVIHYFVTASDHVAGEYHFFRDSLPIRIDHTMVLNQIIKGVSPEQLEVARRLNFKDEDFSTRIFDEFPNGHAVILSFAIDTFATLFRHVSSGFVAPIFLPTVSWSGVRAQFTSDGSPGAQAVERMADYIAAEFEAIGLISEEQFKLNVSETLNRIPDSTVVFILGLFEDDVEIDGAPLPAIDRIALTNRWAQEACRGRSNVRWLRMEKFADPCDAQINHFHFTRKVYFKIFQHIYELLRQDTALKAA